MGFDQSSPVQPISEIRGGSLSVTEEDGRRKTKELIMSNIGFKWVNRLGIVDPVQQTASLLNIKLIINDNFPLKNVSLA